jgi:hypothetical protein
MVYWYPSYCQTYRAQVDAVSYSVTAVENTPLTLQLVGKLYINPVQTYSNGRGSSSPLLVLMHDAGLHSGGPSGSL